MRLPVALAIALFGCVNFAGTAIGQSARQYTGTPVQFLGAVQERADLSAVGQLHSFLLVGSDEAVGKKSRKKNIVQVLREDGEDRYVVHRDIPLCTPLKANGKCKKKKQRKEMDIEGIAVEGNSVYVIGSHSLVRKRVRCEPIGPCNLNCRKPRSYAENRAILTGPGAKSVDREKSGRDRLVRFDLDRDGVSSNMAEISLAPIIDSLDVFKPFKDVPGKENGVDIEGIAVRDGVVYLGFRGPVLRGNYVPVMKIRFDDPVVAEKDILYVKLDGRGIRDLVRVSDGFLILAGPVGGGSDSFLLYHWDGRDMVPGDGARPSPPGRLKLLGAIGHPSCGSPEGMAVQREDGTSYDIIVVFDGGMWDVAHRFKIASNPE